MKRLVLGLLGLLALLVLAYYGLAESGEVVVLETREAAGIAHETRVWVVDHAGFAWLRTGDPKSPWLARLRANPEVAVTRTGVRREYHAVPSDDPALRDTVNALTLEKYGFAEQALRASMMDPDGVTPIRLEPR